jgi:hypothetical protein
MTGETTLAAAGPGEKGEGAGGEATGRGHGIGRAARKRGRCSGAGSPLRFEQESQRI